MGRAVSKSFSPSVIIPGGAVMENKYVSFEVYRPVKSPTEKNVRESRLIAGMQN